MAGRNPSAAVLFMRRCRQPSSASRIVIRAASTSPYDPSNFNKKYSSPIESPSPVAPQPSNLPGPSTQKTPYSAERLCLPAFLERNPTTTPGWRRPKARPTAIGPAHSQTSFWNYMRRSLGMQIPKKKAPVERFNVWNNPYRAHKTWPPKIMDLDHKQQLHFEKTYRRRIGLKWERPVFKRWVIFVQNVMIFLIVWYSVFIYDPPEGTPFDGIRAWLWDKFAGNDLLPERVRSDAGKRVDEFKQKWAALKDTFFEITPVPNLKTTEPVNPEEQKIPWAQRKRKEDT